MKYKLAAKTLDFLFLLHKVLEVWINILFLIQKKVSNNFGTCLNIMESENEKARLRTAPEIRPLKKNY